MKKIFFFLFFSVFSVKIELFISLNCLYCLEALNMLHVYVKKNKCEYKVYILFDNNKKAGYFIEANNNLSIIFDMLSFSFANDKFFFEQISKKYKKIDSIVRKKNYQNQIKEIFKIFKKNKIEGTPTWIVNDEVKYEGVPDKIENIIDLKK